MQIDLIEHPEKHFSPMRKARFTQNFNRGHEKDQNSWERCEWRRDAC